MDTLDHFTTETLNQVIATSGLTEFQRTILDYFFLDDRSDPNMTDFRRLTGLKIRNEELIKAISDMLGVLRSSFASQRINRLGDLI